MKEEGMMGNGRGRRRVVNRESLNREWGNRRVGRRRAMRLVRRGGRVRRE
jgi:hypothetical protein